MTESISKSGILMRSDEALPDDLPIEPDTPIEMELELPQVRGEDAAGRIICRGKVVRSDTSIGATEPGIVAATIAQYHFTR